MYRILLWALFLGGLASCVPHKKIILLQDAASLGDTISKREQAYRIQAKDRLLIRFTSYNTDLSQFFNIQGVGQTGMGGGMGGGAMFLLNTYPVNESGYVDIPMLDSILVAGRTIEEFRDSLQLAVSGLVSDAFINVVLANYQVTVMGEVKGEKVVTSRLNRLTILEALTEAGGMGDFADRKRVRVIRKLGDEFIFGRVDLTDRDVMLSEYFYLHPNDIVYVEQLRSKTALNNLTTVSRVVGIIAGLFLIERVVNVFN